MTPGDDPVILVDLMNLCFRSHYAHPELQADGKHTGVLYGALRAVLALRDVSPRIVWVWDHDVPEPGAPRHRNWREDLLPAYKARRKHDDEGHRIVVSQLRELDDLLVLLGYSGGVGVRGLEADDVIGLLSRRFPRVLIFSTDRDYYQLLGEGRDALVPQRGKTGLRTVGSAWVEREHGVPVKRWAEYLALGGDSSDDITLRGMGPKTAVKLLRAGVDLERPLADQPVAFRASRHGTEAAWESLRRAYHAARIPTDPADPRIAPLLKAADRRRLAGVVTTPSWACDAAREAAAREFARRIAGWNMVSFLSVRHSFFTSTNHRKERPQPCPQNRRPPSTRRTFV